MIRRLFHSKLFVFFLSMFIIGFFMGYGYTTMTSEELGDPPAKILEQLEGNAVQEEKDIEEDISPEEYQGNQPANENTG